jgi:hypothetical protein
MSLSHEERVILGRIADDVSETKDSVARATKEIILLRRTSDAHDTRLDRHDYRIGTIERHLGVGSLAGTPDPVAYHPLSRLASMSTPPPRSPEDLGLKPGDTGSTWLTKDAQAIVRRFEDQEAMRVGAEKALEDERQKAERAAKKTDRLLKRIAWVGGAILAAATVASYFIGHLHL